MELPLCKLCGDRHRLGFCPKFGDAGAERRAWLQGMTNSRGAAQAATVGRQTKPRPLAVGEVAGEPIADNLRSVPQDGPINPPVPREAKPKFDKRAYQRELMRKRRAKADG